MGAPSEQSALPGVGSAPVSLPPAPAKRPAGGKAASVNWAGWAVVLAVVLLWYALVETGAITLEYLPSPVKVVEAGWEQVRAGTLLTALGHTLQTAVVAALLAAVLGVAIGSMVGLLRPVALLTNASIDFLRSVPAVSLMPVLLLLRGASSSSEIVVGAFAGLWPVVVNTIAGVSQVPPRLLEVGRVMHLSPTARLRKILIPSAVPAILVGLRLSVVTTLVVVVITEMLINPAGIGWQLIKAQQALRPDVLFAYAVLTGLLGYLINAALVVGARLCMPGSPVLRTAS